MNKFMIIFCICLLTACSKIDSQKSPNELLLSIKNYSCKMTISCFSNKNTTEYSATQSYSSKGIYSMEFLDNENLKINYENNSLVISSAPLDISNITDNYIEINKNPLYLSYFINTYFNSENSSNVKCDNNKVSLLLPNNNYLHSATLSFENNIPQSLTYFDKNGNPKVNIIYNEFNSSLS